MAARDHATTLVILALSAAAGGYLLLTREQVTTNEAKLREVHLVGLFRPEKLTQVIYERDGEQFTLERALPEADAGDGRLWKVSRGGQSELADQFVVDQAVQAIEYATKLREIPRQEVDRAAFGLEKPRLKITLVMGAQRTTVSLGGPAPKPDNTVYADIDGTVRVTRRDALTSADVPADGFRTRTVMPYLSTECSELSLSSPEAQHRLGKAPSGGWQLADGELAGLRVDRLGFDKVLTAFAELRVDHFLSEQDAKKAQEGQPLVKVAMTPSAAGKAKGEVVLGGVCPGHPDDTVVLREGTSRLAACVGKGAVEAISKALPSLVERRVLFAREDEIEELVIEQGPKKIELARKGMGFHQRAPEDRELPLENAKGLLKQLATLRADEVKKGPLDKPIGKIVVKVASEKEDHPPETLLIGSEIDGRVPVRRETDGALLFVSRDAARVLAPRASALRALRVIDETLDRARRISVKGEGFSQKLERGADGTFTLVDPKGLPADIALAGDMLEAATHLTADSWVADDDDGSFGLDKPKLTFTLDVNPGPSGRESYRVLLADAGALGLHGKVEGSPGVFLTGRGIERSLTALAIDLTVLAVDPAEAERVSLSAGKQELVLGVKRELFTVEKGPALPPPRLALLRDALSNLRAEAAVHAGPPRPAEGFDKPTLEIKVKRTPGRGERSADMRIVIGAADSFRNASIYYARREGVDAVFALPAARVRDLLGLL